MDPAWIVAATSLAAILGGLFLWAMRGFWNLTRQFLDFIREWKGVPESHGRVAQPGVLDRLAFLEKSLLDVSKQVHLNNGSSLRDAVVRIESVQQQLKSTVDGVSKRIDRVTGGAP